MDNELLNAGVKVLNLLEKDGLTLSSAESCTAGLISMTLCAASKGGANYSSDFVTYDDIAKTIMLGVKPHTISHFTAVSSQAVKEMAQGANRVAKTQLALAVKWVCRAGQGERRHTSRDYLVCLGIRNRTCSCRSQKIRGRL